jgi:hypothetical protein
MTRKISVRLSFHLGYIRYNFRLALVPYSVRMSAAYKIVMIRHGESEWNKVSFLAFINLSFSEPHWSLCEFGYTDTDPVLAITLKLKKNIFEKSEGSSHCIINVRFCQKMLIGIRIQEIQCESLRSGSGTPPNKSMRSTFAHGISSRVLKI